MPTVGSFHGKFWRAKANGAGGGGDPVHTASCSAWQGSSHRAMSYSMAIWWVPDAGQRLRLLWDACQRIWRQARWAWRLSRQLRAVHLTDAELGVLNRVVGLMQSPAWADAERAVQDCATTPKFHRWEQWLEYGRAIKGDAGQAQNVYRHLMVVTALRAAHPGLTNPELHLMAELAYQGFAQMDRREARVIPHTSRQIDHDKRLIPHKALVTR